MSRYEREQFRVTFLTLDLENGRSAIGPRIHSIILHIREDGHAVEVQITRPFVGWKSRGIIWNYEMRQRSMSVQEGDQHQITTGALPGPFFSRR